ncbi:hypothetical protein ACS0TY_013004 [Phlomoides rotata]
MGQKAPHVALECTLQSLPNMVILAEEVANSKLTLFDITKQICDAVQARGEQDKHHGVILLLEGLIKSFPEVYALLQLNQIWLRFLHLFYSSYFPIRPLFLKIITDESLCLYLDA